MALLVLDDDASAALAQMLVLVKRFGDRVSPSDAHMAPLGLDLRDALKVFKQQVVRCSYAHAWIVEGLDRDHPIAATTWQMRS